MANKAREAIAYNNASFLWPALYNQKDKYSITANKIDSPIYFRKKKEEESQFGRQRAISPQIATAYKTFR